MAGLDIPDPVPCPGGCGWAVRPEFDTDGHGNLVEKHPLCRKCQPSAFVDPPDHMVIICRACLTPFAHRRKRGRPPVRCRRCRGLE